MSLDAANGAIVAGYAFGISAAMNFAVAIWNGEPLIRHLKSSAQAGLKWQGQHLLQAVLFSSIRENCIKFTIKR